MQKLQFAIFQMDAATRFLADASTASRSTLLLLDEVCEFLIDRWIGQDFLWQAHADMGRKSSASRVSVSIENANLFDVLMDAVRVCSFGQITQTLFEVGGRYRRNM